MEFAGAVKNPSLSAVKSLKPIDYELCVLKETHYLRSQIVCFFVFQSCFLSVNQYASTELHPSAIEHLYFRLKAEFSEIVWV